MELNVAANFDKRFIDEMAKYKEVKTVFGKMATDFVGGGIETSMLQDISRDELREYIEYARGKGISFNYVINAPILNNDEFTKEGKEQLNQLLEFLDTLKLEAVTVANLYMIHYIKKNYPQIRIKTSATLGIDSVDKAKYLESLGVDILVLDPLLVNRNFKMLKAIRNAVSCEIELIVNNNCLERCPYLYYHQSFLGLNSRDANTKISKDFCYTNCSYRRMSEPVNWLKADWIRPEDIKLYEEMGFSRFKIIDRSTPVDVMAKRVKAYANRRYDGNLLDIIAHYGYKDSISTDEYLENVYIDNRKLDGFMDQYVKTDCASFNCGISCRKCYKYAEEAITINKEFKDKVCALKEEEIDMQLDA